MRMQELVWINGRTQPLSEATWHIEDRGGQFADGVYEVIRVYSGYPYTLGEHLERLVASAEGIRLACPYSVEQMAAAVRRHIADSGMAEGMIYMQLSRGVAPRNHLYPKNPEPLLYFYNRALPAILPAGQAPACKLITVEDERWKRCWVKSIALLAAVLAKNEANDRGCDEAVFTENGIVSECSASNFFIVSRGRLITAPVGQKVLPGITRGVLLKLADDLGIPTDIRFPTVYELLNADEVFITSTTREIGWVSHIDGRQVASECGPVTLKIHRAMQAQVKALVDRHARQAVAV
jgi:D-alanine transaminase